MTLSLRFTGAALALTAAALTAGSPAFAADDVKPQDPIVKDARLLPDEAKPTFSPTTGQALALRQIKGQIGEWVAKNGTKYSFATQFDSERGQIVLVSDAPRDLIGSLTATDDPEAREAVAKAEIVEKGVEDDWNRRDDISPFWGGAGVTFGGGICSAGYAVRNAAGAVYSVTAGHCFPNGAKALTESGARLYGVVSGRRLPTVTGQPIDMELMGGNNYVGRIYNGGVFSTSSRGVAAAGTAYVGYSNYCHSGRTTGENCGHTAQDLNAQVCTQTGCKQPVISFTGGNMIQGGDSGGAFYAVDSSGRAWVRGNTIASGGGWGYATPFTQVAAQYGITIVPG